MKIIIISNLSDNIAAGLNWSVPLFVKSLGEFDNILWINLSEAEMNHWKSIPGYHNCKDFGKRFSLRRLPLEFQKPDLVIFEGFYHMKDPYIAFHLRLKKIPYAIVPRGSLTRAAQNIGSLRKRIKKRIANWLIFSPYLKKASFIQYLTKGEAINSGDKWNPTHTVIPNGIFCKNFPISLTSDKLNFIYIGRYDFHNKGIDCFFEAVRIKSAFLKKNNCVFRFYGPLKRYTYNDYMPLKEYIEKYNLSDIIEIHDEIHDNIKENALKKSNIFLLTSRSEGHPMGLLEALSYGIPALVTPETNMAEEIEAFNAGWICKTTSQSIADSLERIVDEKNLIIQKGINAFNLSRNYAWYNLGLRMHEYIEKKLSEQN